MKKIFKAAKKVSLATVTFMVIGALRSKFMAMTIGPGGVGIFSQAAQFFQLAATFASLCIQLGVTRYIANYHAQKDTERVQSVIAVSFLMPLAVCAVFVALAAGFRNAIGELLFSTDRYNTLIAIAAFGVPFTVLAGMSETILVGFGNYKFFAKGRRESIILSFVLLVICVKMFHLQGGFLYLLLGGILSFYVFFFRYLVPSAPRNFIFDALRLKRSLAGSYRKIAKEFLSYSGIAFVTTILNLFVVVFLRSLVIRHFGPEGNGIYQVVFALSAYYLPFFTNGIWTYFYPKVSSLRERSKQFSVEVNHALRFCALGMVPVVIALFLVRTLFVRLIFSSDFLAADRLFSTQLFGDMFYLAFYVLGTSLLATKRLRMYLIVGIANSACLILSYLLLREPFGLKAMTIAYLATNALSAAVVLGYHVIRMRMTIYVRNLILLPSAIGLAGASLFFWRGHILEIPVKAALCLAWIAVSFTKVERRRVIRYAMRHAAEFRS
ncbi:MAG: oligosaccharide flippase family protein [Candidatus Omnitrophota bacterium]